MMKIFVKMSTNDIQHRITLINRLNKIGVRIAGGTIRQYGKQIGKYDIYSMGIEINLDHPWDVSDEWIEAKVRRILTLSLKEKVK